MKNNKKKGFTLVELVVVIAVIAILAGVLIGTFTSVISRANQSKAVQEWKAVVDEAYVEYVAEYHTVPTAVKVDLSAKDIEFTNPEKITSLANVYPLTEDITIVLNDVNNEKVFLNWDFEDKDCTYAVAATAVNTVAANAKSSTITKDTELVKAYVSARLSATPSATKYTVAESTITFDTTSGTDLSVGSIDTGLEYNEKTWSVTFAGTSGNYKVSSVAGA